MLKRNISQKLPLISLLVIFFSSGLKAKVRLPWFFSDNMVMQQQSSSKIWGWTNKTKTIVLTSSWDNKKYTAKPDEKGAWSVFVSTPKAGGPYQITISDGDLFTIKNILIGEVWICSGQSNMEMPMKGYKNQPVSNSNDIIYASGNENIRLYNIPRSVQSIPLDTSKNYSWKMANPSDVRNFSAVGYMFGKMLYDKLKVPIGLINVSYGGSPVEAFMDEETLRKNDFMMPAFSEDTKLNNKVPTVLYNGMLHPLVGFRAKGFIWYQGETNVNHPKEYEKLFPAFVQMLRTQFGYGNFPFYYVQIAPWDYNQYRKKGDTLFNSALLREAQVKSLDKISNSGMAVTMDIGDSVYIHPWDKATVARRLAYLALNKTYDYTGFASQSPEFESIEVKDGKVLVKFKNAPDGLTTFGEPIKNFTIAGKDRIFYPATGLFTDKGIELSAPEVSEPAAVRYAFKDWVKGNLYSTEGLPVPSFRTDTWEDTVQYK